MMMKVGDLVKINDELGILIHTGGEGVFGTMWHTLMGSGEIVLWHGCHLEVVNESR
jgi:hypothetical protein